MLFFSYSNVKRSPFDILSSKISIFLLIVADDDGDGDSVYRMMIPFDCIHFYLDWTKSTENWKRHGWLNACHWCYIFEAFQCDAVCSDTRRFKILYFFIGNFMITSCEMIKSHALSFYAMRWINITQQRK